MSVFERVHMPPLGGATEWLNSEPLGPAELRGRVVLVNFWTLTCINWLRQEPYVRAWSRAYRDDGLVVIGVHTPEFSFEHDIDGVRRATKERAIDYPVALDNDYEIWSAFANNYWPALYFVDADGVFRDDHFGEGRTSSRSALSRGCSASSASSSPSKGSAWRRRPTGTTCVRPRRIWATCGASGSGRRTACP
jgi:thiol-disulfide isomerase/thioredoxin